MLDLQRGIVHLLEAVLALLDRLYLVIQSFQSCVVDRVIAMVEQTIGAVIERLGEARQGFDATLFRSLCPVSQKERNLLLATASSDTPLHRLLLRAHPGLMAAEGASSQSIARKRI